MFHVDDKIIGVTLGELRQQFELDLGAIYSVDEIRHHFATLCEKYFGYSPAQVVLHLNKLLSTADIDLLTADLTALKNNMPIQYVVGKVEFAHVSLEVNQSVLIPRPETEELVHWMISSTPNNKSLRILDIGTGSGSIALALKSACPLWEVSAWDIDQDALDVAKHNASRNNLDVDFDCIDVLAKKLPKEHWDIIVSNPPYVPQAWEKHTALHVLEHEPHHAIFVPDKTPLLFYHHIATYASEQLAPNGTLFLEGHSPLMKSVQNLLKKAGFSDIVLQKDFRENHRFLRAKVNGYSSTN